MKSTNLLPWWLSQQRICLKCRRPWFHPWVGKIRWRRKWLRTPVFLPEESHGQRSLMGYSPRGHKELALKRLSTHATWLKCIRYLKLTDQKHGLFTWIWVLVLDLLLSEGAIVVTWLHVSRSWFSLVCEIMKTGGLAAQVCVRLKWNEQEKCWAECQAQANTSQGERLLGRLVVPGQPALPGQLVSLTVALLAEPRRGV